MSFFTYSLYKIHRHLLSDLLLSLRVQLSLPNASTDSFLSAVGAKLIDCWPFRFQDLGVLFICCVFILLNVCIVSYSGIGTGEARGYLRHYSVPVKSFNCFDMLWYFQTTVNGPLYRVLVFSSTFGESYVLVM